MPNTQTILRHSSSIQKETKRYCVIRKGKSRSQKVGSQQKHKKVSDSRNLKPTLNPKKERTKAALLAKQTIMQIWNNRPRPSKNVLHFS